MNSTSNSTFSMKTPRTRAKCRTVQASTGDNCSVLAKKCGISHAELIKHNPGADFCSTLRPKKHVCCSSGDLSELRPQSNQDGSCHTYQVKTDDNCDDLAAEYGLKRENLEEFKKNTWGWNGCRLLSINTFICLSKGTPPFPAPIANAVCGPQKPGSKPPTDGSGIDELNPCPMNSCATSGANRRQHHRRLVQGLAAYHDVATPVKNWDKLKRHPSSKDDPETDHTRNSNWTQFDCTHQLIKDKLDYTPSERWSGLNADAAWKDVVRIWQDTDSHRKEIYFTQSVSSTLRMGAVAKCGELEADNCAQAVDCPNGANVKIHQLYSDYYKALFQVAAISSTALKDLENKFAPIPPPKDKTSLLLFIDLITVGTLSTAGPFFNSFLKKLPYFVERDVAFNNVKDTTMTMIGQSTTIAKDLLPSGGKAGWMPEKQDTFSNYMGQTIDAWANVTWLALEKVFDGSPESIDILWSTISDGKLVEGRYEKQLPKSGNLNNELRANVAKSSFGCSIPALWWVSSSYAFVIDSGYGCDKDKPLGDYLMTTPWRLRVPVSMADNTTWPIRTVTPRNATAATVLEAAITANAGIGNFSVPPGLKSLDGTTFGGITKDDLIRGSVRTNGAGFADPTNKGAIDLLDVDVTTPGFMRIPVCSPERAFQSWDTSKKGSSEHYPCDIPPGKSHCGDSKFVDQTSDASPKVEDCLAIMRNIEGDGGSDWTTQVIGKSQCRIVRAGSCNFGVEATKVNGNVNFKVGGKMSSILSMIQLRCLVKAGSLEHKGDMQCHGNVKKQPVKWGIY
ncbi:hypothetical protein AJ79_05278 [Helicocarpus griseus UAMH5409]|uniref:LysM domain-containing protein n=1 Tax=Helicocarpus griseus UAMH5409 TaxID=1447875 RepID=A0A2B7XPD0_9EURO|nr:hypothetical protein AJ79_05278 [Helicocarpus griseus UAMH5409]